ncbi:MAG: DNA mismatch repair protein MutS [Chloroflexi bacterium]|nr:DNA mismatch repair protein MutS [Chloroflexota bacterium]
MAERAPRQSVPRSRPRAGSSEPLATDVPSRRQYLQLKQQHPHALLLYRLGDFYEAFDEDADVVARDARITLTSRNFGRSGRVRMAGIPHHALNHYLGRLLAAGHTLAIAEQMSEPGRGLVERAVTRVLSPGTVADGALLPAGESRYLAAVAAAGPCLGLAWLDVSTGEFATLECGGDSAAERLAEELARINPAELLVPDDGAVAVPATGHQTRLAHWLFEPARASAALVDAFGVRSLAAYGCAAMPAAVGAAGAVLAYVERTNPGLLPLLTGLRTETVATTVGLDAATRRNLELTRSLRTGGARGSLLGVLDVTRTAMGARAVRRLLGQPLRDLTEISHRQALVAALVAAPVARAQAATTLARLGDLERQIGRISQGQAGVRDFLALRTALAHLPDLIGTLGQSGQPALAKWAAALDPCAGVLALLASAVDERPDGGGAVRLGFWPALDAALTGSSDTRRWLAGLEQAERERTGIRSLRVGFNRVFGYYIEVTRPNLALVPDDYVRKQTVAGGERFFTAALKEAEARLLAADDEIAAHERAALAYLSAGIIADVGPLQATAARAAHLDALLALAEVAARQRWTRPTLDDSDRLEITGGRHPVVEAALGGEPFLPNDCRLGKPGPRLLLVTGPNMGGKSTYLRQVALIVLLAQIGSFVPADAAHIGLADRIFSRVGAQDDLAGGASTFMVEMIETAVILHQATRRSLVILDEVGRGTSTDDGLALAQAVLEDLHDRVQARGLFATHFLELTALAGWHSVDQHSEMIGRADAATEMAGLPHVANVHVAALESDERVILLHAVRPGPASRAYGIHVARLAGLPPAVVDRAAVLAASDSRRAQVGEQPARYAPGTTEAPTVSDDAGPRQLSLTGLPATPDAPARLARALRAIDLDALTPGQAIDWLIEQQARLGGPGR